MSLLGSLAVAGLVLGNQGPNDGIPDTVKVAAPRVGDHGIYRVSIPDHLTWPLGTDDWDPEVHRLVGFAYEERGTAEVLDRDGAWRSVEAIVETRRWVERDNPDQVAERQWTHDLARPAWVPLQRTYHGFGVSHLASSELLLPTLPLAPPEPAPAWPESVGEIETIHRNNDETGFAHPNTLFCGHRHSAQDRPLDRHATLVAYGACDGHIGQGDPAGVRFVLDGRDRYEGMDVLVYQTAGEPDGTRLSFHPDLPVPVRIDLAAPDGSRVVVELERFDRGADPLMPLPDPGRSEPPVASVPAGRWGPETGTFPVAWPLSDAFAAARDHPDDPRVRDFLASHRDAIIAVAQSWSGLDRSETPAQRVDTWEFILGDGPDGQWVSVSKRTADGTTGDIALPSEVAEPTQQYTLDAREVEGPWPRADQLPRTMPAPAAVYARMKAINGSMDQPGQEAYGFAHWCLADCAEVVSYTVAGRDHGEWPEPEVVSFASVSSRLRSANLLAILVDGRALDMEQVESYHRSQTGLDPWFDGSGAPMSGGFEAGADVVGAGWVLPAARLSIALTLLSIALGFLYRVWPYLQTLPILSVLFRPAPDDVLDNQVRRLIHDTVRAEPGIHYSALMRRVGHGNHVVRHHLDRLLSENLVVERQGGRYACYFPPGVADRRTLDAAPVLKSGQASAVLRGILEQPGVSGRELAAALGVAPGTVSYHTKRLEDAGLVVVRPDGRHRRFHPSSLAAGALDAMVGTRAAA